MRKGKPVRGGLGQGLDSIFVENTLSSEGSGQTLLPISSVQPNLRQPRTHFSPEALASLVESIRQVGVLQPIAVREIAGNLYEIVAGERRYRAAREAGLHEIPAVVLTLDEKKAAQIALIENVQREDLSPIDLARAYKRLIKEYRMTQEEVAQAAGCSRPAVANTLRLLELPPEVIEMIDSRALTEGHGRALLAAPPSAAVELARTAVSQGLSVRNLEALARRTADAMEPDSLPAKDARGESSEEREYLSRLSRRICERLGRTARIKGKKGDRRLELSFDSDDDLELLLRRLCGDDIFE